MLYELELPSSMKIHPVISVIHLDQAREDTFERPTSSYIARSEFIIIDDEEQYVIERLVSKSKNKKEHLRLHSQVKRL